MRRARLAVSLCVLLWRGLAAAAGAPADSTDEAQLWQQVEQAPDQPGRWLDLAVHYCESGQARAAERIFRLLEDRHIPPPGIQTLIDHLRSSGCHAPPPAASNAFHLRLLAGTDSNPNQGLATDALALTVNGQTLWLPVASASRPQPDTWQGAELAWLAAGAGWQPFALGSLRRYRSQTAFDTNQLILGMHDLDAAGRETRVGMGLMTLAGRLYHTQLFGQAQRPLPWGDGLDVLAGAAYSQFPDYPSQDSLQLDLRLMLSLRPAAQGVLRLQLGALLDQPMTSRPGGSRHGLLLRADARHPLAGGWMLEGHLHGQTLRESAPYSPLFGTTVRAGREWSVRLGLGRALSSDSSLTLSVEQVRAADAIPLFAYRREQITIAIAHLFR